MLRSTVGFTVENSEGAPEDRQRETRERKEGAKEKKKRQKEMRETREKLEEKEMLGNACHA